MHQTDLLDPAPQSSATPSLTNFLEHRIRSRIARIGVVGLGYVGLPLLWTFHRSGFRVLGFDIDDRKIRHFESGTPYIRHFGAAAMAELADSGRCEATTEFCRVAEADALLLCVPTPLDAHREPDMSYVVSTLVSIAPYLREGQLVALESTTYPGTTDELVVTICERGSGLKAGRDFFVAYSPEREDPGNPNFRTATIPKVVGAIDPESLRLAVALYSSIVVQVVPVTSVRTAEAVKLLENIFRSVNIALVNELKVVLRAMDIDIHEVIEAARSKPFGFMPFYPGPGLGGHCIPIDPFYLTWKAREFGLNTRFIELAGEVNRAMPAYVVQRCVEVLNAEGRPARSSRVLCVGLAYKPNVDDMRESPTFEVMDRLAALGAVVEYYDPLIPVIPESREHARWTGRRSMTWEEVTLARFDLAVVLTHHAGVDHATLPQLALAVVDARNAVPAGPNVYPA